MDPPSLPSVSQSEGAPRRQTWCPGMSRQRAPERFRWGVALSAAGPGVLDTGGGRVARLGLGGLVAGAVAAAAESSSERKGGRGVPSASANAGLMAAAELRDLDLGRGGSARDPALRAAAAACSNNQGECRPPLGRLCPPGPSWRPGSTLPSLARLARAFDDSGTTGRRGRRPGPSLAAATVYSESDATEALEVRPEGLASKSGGVGELLTPT